MKSVFKQPDDSPGFILWKLTTEWQKKQRNALSDFGLTHIQFVFLACLEWLETNTENYITQSQISEISKIDKMVVSETARKLIKKDLIKRNVHKLDHRAYALELTAKGSNLIALALPVVESIDTVFFNENNQRIDYLNKIVSKFVKN